MAWDRKRRGLEEVGPWAFLTHNVSFALLTLMAVVLLIAGRSQGSVVDTVRSVAQDIVSPVFSFIAGPSSLISRWTEGIGATLEIYAENQSLREENAKLLAYKNQAIELQQKVSRYEALLNTAPQPGIEFVTGRVIADAGGSLAQTLIVNAGQGMGVKVGQAVTNEQGLVGHIVNAGNQSARVLLLKDLGSRIPVRLERANVKAILAGDNSASPSLEFLPRNTVLVAGDRVITASDGGVFPPGIPVGTLTEEAGSPRVTLFADERRADYVRILKYTVQIDVDEIPGVVNPELRPQVEPPSLPPFIASPAGLPAVTVPPAVAMPVTPGIPEPKHEKAENSRGAPAQE
jgi:rod shape-determining protein MreC